MANAALVVEDIAATTPVSSRPVPAGAPAAEPDKVEANGLELRNDAISCLTRWDVRFVRRFAAAPSQSGALDPVGRYYAFIDGPDVVSWRRLTDDQVVHRWHCEGNICMSLAVSPNGRYVYTYCKDARQRLKLYCYVWDSITGSLVLQRPIFSWDRAFRPDGKVLALPEADGSVTMCDLANRRNLSSLRPEFRPQNLAFPLALKILPDLPSGPDKKSAQAQRGAEIETANDNH